MKDKNHYEILGVSRNASLEEIKKAYKKLALQLHPDKKASVSGERIKKVNEANRILRDPDLRKEYDEDLARQEKVKPKTPQAAEKPRDRSPSPERKNGTSPVERDVKWFMRMLEFQSKRVSELNNAITPQQFKDLQHLENVQKNHETKESNKDVTNQDITNYRHALTINSIYKVLTSTWNKTDAIISDIYTVPVIRYKITDLDENVIKNLRNYLTDNGLEPKQRYSSSLKSDIIEISGKKNVENFKKLQAKLNPQKQEQQEAATPKAPEKKDQIPQAAEKPRYRNLSPEIKEDLNTQEQLIRKLQKLRQQNESQEPKHDPTPNRQKSPPRGRS